MKQPCDQATCPFCNADDCRADWELFLECQRIFFGATVECESLETMPAWYISPLCPWSGDED